MNSKLKVIEETSWYEEGLHFSCTGCGKCCFGAPGYVWVSEEEISHLASFLKISVDQLKSKYLVQVGDKYSIRDLKHANYSCVFLRDNKCTVYPARPNQCKTYPFWPSIMRSKETWDKEAFSCEGIREKKERVSFSEIKKKLSDV